MNNRGDIEFALRLRTDLEQGQRELEGLAQSVGEIGDAATASSSQLNQVGETAAQQAARIRLMVDASLQQQAAAQGVTDSLQRSTAATQEANSSWQQNAAAQTQAMNAYIASERAAEQKAAADLNAAAAAKKAAGSVEQEAQELQQLLGKIDPVIRKLDELDNMEQKLRSARSSGRIDLDTYTEFNNKLQEQRKRLGGTSDAMHIGAISAGQYEQAMRQLPAQITDITTSLASGQPIWLVATQQGGQIIDSFGGWAEAGRALISSINPLTLAIASITAVVGGTALAFVQGAAENYEFEKAITLTGNSAGVTADSLAQMAEQIDGMSGTQRQAAAALAEVTAEGKFTADQILLIGTTAVVMENSVGQAVSATVEQFKRLADEPAQASAALNEQYNYLTVAVYEQIVALEAQGDSAGAAQLAMESLANAMQGRAVDIAGNLGLIESAWEGIKNVAGEAWDAMLDVGRKETLEDQLANVQRQRETAMYGVRGDRVNPSIDPAQEARFAAEEKDIRRKIALEAEQAKQTADSAAKEREGIAASRERAKAADAFVKSTEAQLQSLLKLTNVQRAQQLIQEQGIAATSEQAQRILSVAKAADQQKAANEAETDAKRKATEEQRKATQAQKEAERASAAALRTAEQASRQQLNYVQALEDQARKLGMTAAEVRQYELAERGLAGAMQARAQAALVLIDAAERQREVDADSQQLSSMRADLLEAQGDQSGAAAIQIEQRYSKLMDRLQARGDQAGIDLVNSLINVEQAQAQLDQLNQGLEQIFADQSRREQTINTQQDAGLISELGARQQILDLNKATATEVEKLLPKMRELAAVTGDPAAIERIKDLEVRLGNLKTVANEFSNALKLGFENGIQGALKGLADGTMNLQEAATSFLTSIGSAIADLAAQQLAQQATAGLMSLFGGGSSETDMVAGATAVSGSAAALATAGGTLITGAAAIQAAATTLAVANGTSGGSGGGGGAGSWFSAIAGAFSGSAGSAGAASAGYTGAYGFAEGGHVLGPGTPTSDSIPARLSNNEFVTRAAVVTQPGMLPLLHDINARGMVALDDWAGRVRHSTGGLAGVPAPSLPAPTMSGSKLADPAKSGATLKNDVNLYLMQNPDEIASMAWGKSGKSHFYIEMEQNAATVRQILGIN